MLFISQCIHPALLKKVSGMRAIGINPYSNNQLCYQRFAAWRRWRFSALTFIRSTNVYIPTKLSYEALNRHFCQTAVMGWRSVCRCSVGQCLVINFINVEVKSTINSISFSFTLSSCFTYMF